MTSRSDCPMAGSATIFVNCWTDFLRVPTSFGSLSFTMYMLTRVSSSKRCSRPMRWWTSKRTSAQNCSLQHQEIKTFKIVYNYLSSKNTKIESTSYKPLEKCRVNTNKIQVFFSFVTLKLCRELCQHCFALISPVIFYEKALNPKCLITRYSSTDGAFWS